MRPGNMGRRRPSATAGSDGATRGDKRQTTGFVESLLGLIGPGWTVPAFSTLSRRQKTLKVNIPYRGSGGPLHLLIDSTGIKVEGEGEWNARKHGGTKRRVWRKIHIHCPLGEWNIRREGELMSKHWRSAPPSSPPAMLVTSSR